METVLPFVVAAYFAAAFYLLMSTHLIRILLGVALLGNGVNLLIFTSGRISSVAPPIIHYGGSVPLGPIANPLPEALILTAIVISFSFFSFLLVLSFRAYQDLGVDDTDEMRFSEPEGEGHPPLGY